MKSFFKPASPSPLCVEGSSIDNAISQVGTTSVTNTVQSFIIPKEVQDAEILWCLKTVKSHFSFRSCKDAGKLFSRMFPDSEIAKKFQCGERKCGYICRFGLAPYFHEQLYRCLADVSHYTLLFDETLNRSNQQKQLDIHVRFWHPENKVRTQYLTSVFLGHATASNILESFYEACKKLDLSKLVHISMDGPSVNWKFYKMLEQDLKKELNIQCVTIGSCGLHILNNAFRKGAVASQWDISSLLSSLHWIFKDSPARREDFLQSANLKKLPLSFCSHRWLENIKCTERAIEIWDDVILYVRNVERKCFPKPSCKSFSNISEAVRDNLIGVKLNVFLSVAKLVEPFLGLYQSDAPLLPFFAEDTLKFVKKCLHLFKVLKLESVAQISTTEELAAFDFADKNCFAHLNNVRLGFVGDKILKEKVGKNEASQKEALAIKQQCQTFIIKMLENLMDKCPINYSLVRNIAAIDPRLMASSAKICNTKMRSALVYLSQKKLVCDDAGDEIMLQYSDFLESVVKQSSAEFKNFDPKLTSLDTFFGPYFINECKYDKLWGVLKIMMILSHGQASVERGFSVNKAIEVENLKEESYISKRIIYDHIKFCGDVLDVPITSEMRVSTASAKKLYKQYLESQKVIELSREKQEKRKLFEEEISLLRKKKVCLQEDVAEAEKTVESLSERAEACKDINLFIKANTFRKSLKQKQAQICETEQKIGEKQKELKNI